MNTRRVSVCLVITFFLTLTFCNSGALAKDDLDASDKVLDAGHTVHNVGQIHHHVSNWGLLGSTPTDPPTIYYQHSPSAMWPPGSGDEYIWAAGLWVGGIVQGEQLVSTGAFSSEFLPTEAVADTVHFTAHGAPGGSRYPWPNPDDDGDGLEDEDILNGLDDDGDGLVDEDFAGIGDQHFVCSYNDFDPAIQENRPDHNPLNLNIVQQSIQWSNPLADEFIGYEFTITNMGGVDIEQVHLGMFSDSDIGWRGYELAATDDYAGFVSTTYQASNGAVVPVQVAYMYDGYAYFGNGLVDGYVGWVLCGHTTDPEGVVAPVEPGVNSFHHFVGNASFDQGGDPTNDAERYEMMSIPHWDPDTQPPWDRNDYRVLMSSGPFPSLAPGQSLSYQVALVLGDGLEDMLANAAEAVAAYQGVSYDRDQNPANGDEFTVHWLLAEDGPVAASSGRIAAQVVPGGVELQIESNLDAASGLAVVRRTGSITTGMNEHRWEGSDLTLAANQGNDFQYRLLDTDQAGWPREYILEYGEPGGALSLGQVNVEGPKRSAMSLSASPNPFNPRVNISFNLPQPGRVVLKIFDLHGRLVRTLVDEDRAEGTDTVVWQGDDNSGRALASGVYQLRMSTEGQLMEERLTLVR
jgi:FlgD Ig-like domain